MTLNDVNVNEIIPVRDTLHHSPAAGSTFTSRLHILKHKCLNLIWNDGEASFCWTYFQDFLLLFRRAHDILREHNSSRAWQRTALPCSYWCRVQDRSHPCVRQKWRGRKSPEIPPVTDSSAPLLLAFGSFFSSGCYCQYLSLLTRQLLNRNSERELTSVYPLLEEVMNVVLTPACTSLDLEVWFGFKCEL